MGTAENKDAQRRIIDEVINRKNLDLADELFVTRPVALAALTPPRHHRERNAVQSSARDGRKTA